MCIATHEREGMAYYLNKPSRYIYHTIGPKGVAKFLKEKGYEPTVQSCSQLQLLGERRSAIPAEGNQVVSYMRCFRVEIFFEPISMPLGMLVGSTRMGPASIWERLSADLAAVQIYDLIEDLTCLAPLARRIFLGGYIARSA